MVNNKDNESSYREFSDTLFSRGYKMLASEREAYELIRKRIKHYIKHTQRGESLPAYQLVGLSKINKGVFFKFVPSLYFGPKKQRMLIWVWDGEIWHAFDA